METKTPFIIGICGGAWGDGGVGKTSVANFLVSRYDFRYLSLVKPVEKVAKTFFDLEKVSKEEVLGVLDAVCRIGRHISEDYWLNMALSELQGKNIDRLVVDDVWFNNEVKWIVKSGGVILRINKKNHSTIDFPCEIIDIDYKEVFSFVEKELEIKLKTIFMDKGLVFN